MSNKLLESNKDIDNLIRSLDDIIVKLRISKKLDKDIIDDLKDFYDIEIDDYMKDYYLRGKEVSSDYEDYISDKILDLIVALRQIEK